MDSSTKFYIGAGIVIAIFLIGFGWCIKPCPEIKESKTSTTTTNRDTVKIPQIVYRDTVIVKTRYKIIDKSRIDTLVEPLLAGYDSLDFPVLVDSVNDLYLTPPFEYGYHTITDNTKDSIEIKYSWPSNKLVFTLQPAPREKIIEKIKETITVTLEKQKAWYEEQWFEWSVRGVLFIGGVYVGSQINGGAK